MSHKTSARPAHFFERQLDPKVVARVAIVKRSHSPGQLGPIRVIGGMVVSAIVSQLLHEEKG
jgi:hypothetical protein